MQRRRFLKVLGTGAAGLAASRTAPALARDGKTVRCPVAGVSFNRFDVFRLRENEPVIVRRETFRGQLCYRVLHPSGPTIGFVPRGKLPFLERREVQHAWLSRANPYAVPWKQLEITVALV